MKIFTQPIMLVLILAGTIDKLHSQGIKVGEVLIFSGPGLKKEVNAEALPGWLSKVKQSSWDKSFPGTAIHLFQADRGNAKGELMLAVSVPNAGDRKSLPAGNPLSGKLAVNSEVKSVADFLKHKNAYTEYHLVGAEKLKAIPDAGILGIHYLQVKPDRAAAFEKFVADKLHPAVGHLFPDMQLLYYKAVAGEGKGSYITIFSIASVAARDKYWPGGAAETETLKNGFRPLKDLALELSTYLVEDSYLKPDSGGAAAYFESLKWTDFVYDAGPAK